MHDEALLGYVLKWVTLTGNKNIVTLFTREDGKREVMLRVARKGPAAAYLTPFNLLQLKVRGKQQQKIANVADVSLARSSFALGSHYRGLCLLHHWAYLLDQCQPVGQPDDQVFRLLDHALFYLNGVGRPNIAAANLYFESWLLFFCGMLTRPKGKDDLGLLVLESERDPAGLAVDPMLSAPAGDACSTEGFLPLLNVFQQKIEQFARNDLKWVVLQPASTMIGRRWQAFLAKEIKTRKTLIDQIKEHP